MIMPLPPGEAERDVVELAMHNMIGEMATAIEACLESGGIAVAKYIESICSRLGAVATQLPGAVRTGNRKSRVKFVALMMNETKDMIDKGIA